MFRASCRSSSPFSVKDFEMWDTESRYASQSSEWYDLTGVSGTGLLSNVNKSASGTTAGFRQNDPGLKKWQSLSHLVPEGTSRPFTSASAPWGSSFRQSEVKQWLQSAHERMDTHVDQVSARDASLSFNTISAQLRDIRNKFSEVKRPFEQKREEADSFRFEKNLQQKELHEKVQKLEKDLLQMRFNLDRGSSDQPPERRQPANSQWAQKDSEKEKVNTELSTLREALKESELRANTCEEERNQALQQIQTLNETQRALLGQIEEMNRMLSHSVSNHTDVQNQLSDANNKISQACLEKAVLSTQVMKLEDDIKELKAKLKSSIQEGTGLDQKAQALQPNQKTTPGPEGHHSQTVDNISDPDLRKDGPKALKEVNEKLSSQLDVMKQELDQSRSQLQELREENMKDNKQRQELEAQHRELISQKEELLSRMKNGGIDSMEERGQLRELVEALKSEKEKLQDQCVSLEAEVLDNEEKLHQLEANYQRQDAARAQTIEELKGVASHWTEKWQKVALTLQLTQEEVDNLRRKNERESESLLRIELEALKQELELERSRRQSLLHNAKDEGEESRQRQDKEMLTDSSVFREPPPDPDSSPNESSQSSSTEQEGNKTVHVGNTSTDAEAFATSQDWTPSYSNVVGSTVDRWSCQQKPGLMPVMEEDEESDDDQLRGEEEEPRGEKNLPNQRSPMSGTSANTSHVKEESENQLQAVMTQQPIQDHLVAAADECDLQKRQPPLYPDGIFLAVPVNVCSNDEDEEEEEEEGADQ